MQKILFLLFTIFTMGNLNAQVKKDNTIKFSKPTIVDAACGQCQFHLKTQKGCDLAIQVNSMAYFVDGTKIDEHGDAHANDGFCNAIRKALVQGTVVNNRFVATSFKLLTEEELKKLKEKKKG
jgi:hypothetical protein